MIVLPDDFTRADFTDTVNAWALYGFVWSLVVVLLLAVMVFRGRG